MAAVSAFLALLGLRPRGRSWHGRPDLSDREREEREIRSILSGTSDEPKTSRAAHPTFVADSTVRFACAECGELTPSSELEDVKRRRLCAACREALSEEETAKTYRE